MLKAAETRKKRTQDKLFNFENNSLEWNQMKSTLQRLGIQLSINAGGQQAKKAFKMNEWKTITTTTTIAIKGKQ